MEKLMYGYNFEVCIGIDVFDGTTHTDFEKSIKEKYPNTNPSQYPLLPLSHEELVEDIKGKLDYRGDGFGSGLELTKKKEIELKDLQANYIGYLKGFINERTKSFSYTYPDGIPGYPVYWDYCYVLFADDNKIVLVYGSASD